jgi:3-deoxy-D-manno-octulosonic-acid transferase
MGEKAIILGSTWPKDELFITPFILKNPDQKFILAPHTIDEKHIASIEKLLHGRTSRYTDKGNNQVLILNTIGHLASAYAYGKIAYVGGGFTGKLHNILEPSVFGLPVLFGPKFKKFPEAKQFIENGIGFTISNSEEFEKTIAAIEKNLDEISGKTADLVLQNTGASKKILSHLEANFIL